MASGPPILCLIRAACPTHGQGVKRTFLSLHQSQTFSEIIAEHGCLGSEANITMATAETGPWTSLERSMYKDSVAHLVTTFDCKFLKLASIGCSEASSDSNDPAPKRQKTNAFDVLFQASRQKKGLPTLKTASATKREGLTRKDELYNDFLQLLKVKQQAFDNPNLEGTYVADVVTHALWYCTNQHQVINDAALKQAEVSPIPIVFAQFQGYNDVKRKKTKECPMSGPALNSHSDALFSLCTRPSINCKSNQFLLDSIKALAECLSKYAIHLEEKNKASKQYQNSTTPARDIGDNTTVRHFKASMDIPLEYQVLDKALKEQDLMVPLFFDESVHLNKPFTNNMQRFRFMENVKLSYPVDIFSYCPGGNVGTTHCFVKVREGRSPDDMMSDTVATTARIRSSLPEYHTRMMRKIFKLCLSNIASLQPSIVDMIYKELSLDASTATHPETHERMRLIFLGEVGLLTDLWKLNTGRPTGAFDEFFMHLGQVIEDVTAADDRRHNVAHLSEWISLKDLMNKAKDRCSLRAAIPSKDLVRIQFTPKNPYTHAALNFTSKFEVQYKIQRRQLRMTHMDSHYCAALFKYMKEYSLLLPKDESVLFFCDDKAKVHIGEPGLPTSTGVRNKKSLMPTSTTLVAADHDLHTKACLTPSVYMKCDVPETLDKSFYRGEVNVTLNDSVFQASSPFRHTTAIMKEVKSSGNRPKVLLKYTDGGTDHRNTLEAVKCANICLFKELNLDLLIAARCAPGQSWVNPAERVMSILNIGLQNVALARESCSEKAETSLKRCSKMDDIRKLASSNPEIKDEWEKSIEATKIRLADRFRRLTLKEVPFKIHNPVSDEETDNLKRHLTDLFPTLDQSKLVKLHTTKNEKYMEWMSNHCIQQTYCLQIQKCDDPDCCSPSQSRPQLLPSPILDDTGKHYKPLSEVLGSEPDEKDRLSKKVQDAVKAQTSHKGKNSMFRTEQRNKAAPIAASVNEETTSTISQAEVSMSAQTARLVVECIECRKSRLIYSLKKLGDRDMMTLVKLLSEHDYTCGSAITPPKHRLSEKVTVRMSLTCESPIEAKSYNICYFCGGDDAERDQQLLKQYKSVYPLCIACKNKGYEPHCIRPFGKKK